MMSESVISSSLPRRGRARLWVSLIDLPAFRSFSTTDRRVALTLHAWNGLFRLREGMVERGLYRARSLNRFKSFC
ncbi:protein of unknown function [Paraburkholderia kururiensis]